MIARLLLLVFCAAVVTACSNSSSSTSSSSPSPVPSVSAATDVGEASASPSASGETTSAAEVAATQAAISAAPAPVASANPTVAATAAVALAPAATPTRNASSKLKKVALTDISGTLAQKQIIELAQLGAIEPATGKFHPHDPLTRGTYVRWLVLANNRYFDSSQQIRLPEDTSNQAFVDVPPSNPNYKYIQGLADAGFVVGIDAKHFAPDRPITREELMAIYEGRVSNGGNYSNISNIADSQLGFKDADQISKHYWGAFNQDHWNGNNLRRIFGEIGIFHPQRPATREEAVISISVIGTGSADSTVQAAISSP